LIGARLSGDVTRALQKKKKKKKKRKKKKKKLHLLSFGQLDIL